MACESNTTASHQELGKVHQALEAPTVRDVPETSPGTAQTRVVGRTASGDSFDRIFDEVEHPERIITENEYSEWNARLAADGALRDEDAPELQSPTEWAVEFAAMQPPEALLQLAI